MASKAANLPYAELEASPVSPPNWAGLARALYNPALGPSRVPLIWFDLIRLGLVWFGLVDRAGEGKLNVITLYVTLRNVT